MKKLFACTLVALMASCSGHHAFAMDLSKEPRSALVEDQRGDYNMVSADLVLVQGQEWLRITYLPAPWYHDQTMKICIKPASQADYTGLPMICMSIIRQTVIEKGIY